ncbi:MAG: hypothetical protein M5U29_18070 [Anaerolineae bacterium]|nr:hypothetical protein [Anaerolineae bacterium]
MAIRGDAARARWLAPVQRVVAGYAVGGEIGADLHGERDRLAGERIAGGQREPVLHPPPRRPVMDDFQFVGGERPEDEFHRRPPE